LHSLEILVYFYLLAGFKFSVSPKQIATFLYEFEKLMNGNYACAYTKKLRILAAAPHKYLPPEILAEVFLLARMGDFVF